MSISEDKKWSELSVFEKYKFLENTATDCTFIVGITNNEIKRIQCHKKVLAECSDVFNSMFNGNYLESEENCEIRLNDVLPCVFQIFVNFIYWGDLPNTTSTKDLTQLSYLSDKYIIHSLSDELEELLRNRCDVTFLELVECLTRPISNNCVNIIIGSAEALYNTDFDLSPSIYNLSPSFFLTLFKGFSVKLDRLRQFGMVEEYVYVNFIRKKRYVKNVHDTEILTGSNKIFIEKLLSMIRIEDMTVKQFLDGPMKSSIIDAHTKLNALIKISERYIPKKSVNCVNVAETHDYY